MTEMVQNMSTRSLLHKLMIFVISIGKPRHSYETLYDTIFILQQNSITNAFLKIGSFEERNAFTPGIDNLLNKLDMLSQLKPFTTIILTIYVTLTYFAFVTRKLENIS